jgi:hypothetical protein
MIWGLIDGWSSGFLRSEASSVLMWWFGMGLDCWGFEFTKRYSRLWTVETVSSMRQKRYASISAFMSLRSRWSLRVICTQLPCPKGLFLLSTPWTSLTLFALAIAR